MLSPSSHYSQLTNMTKGNIHFVVVSLCYYRRSINIRIYTYIYTTDSSNSFAVQTSCYIYKERDAGASANEFPISRKIISLESVLERRGNASAIVLGGICTRQTKYKCFEDNYRYKSSILLIAILLLSKNRPNSTILLKFN